MNTLRSTTPYHIRCLKPNSLMKRRYFDEDLVTAQLAYVGMLDTVKIRKLGYPFRFSFQEFVAR